MVCQNEGPLQLLLDLLRGVEHLSDFSNIVQKKGKFVPTKPGDGILGRYAGRESAQVDAATREN